MCDQKHTCLVLHRLFHFDLNVQPLPAAGNVTADVTVSGRSVGVLFCLQRQSQSTHPHAPTTEGVDCCDFTTVLKTTWCCNAPATGVPDLCVLAAAGWVLCTNTTWSSWEKHRGLSEKKMWQSYFMNVKTLRTYIYLLEPWSALTWCYDALDLRTLHDDERDTDQKDKLNSWQSKRSPSPVLACMMWLKTPPIHNHFGIKV